MFILLRVIAKRVGKCWGLGLIVFAYHKLFFIAILENQTLCTNYIYRDYTEYREKPK